MKTSRVFSYLSVVAAAAVPATVSAAAAREPLNGHDRRQNSCPAITQSCQAVDPKLPSNFCCPTGTSCWSLDSSSTAVCCPDGKSCSTIQPISCDISLEDPAKEKSGPVFTTRLKETLSSCPGSDKCCPFGYTCSNRTNGSAFCEIVASKAITLLPNSATRSTSAVSSSSTTSTATISAVPRSSTTLSSSIDSTRPPPESSQTSDAFPVTVFLAGFFPGMVVGALGVLAWVIFTGRHRKTDDDVSATTSMYKKKPYISGPISDGSQSTRTDFLRKGNGVTKSAMSFFSKRNRNEGTPGLPFDSWKMPTAPEPNNVPHQPVGRYIPAGPDATSGPPQSSYPAVTQYPVTPERQIYGRQSESGTETIQVYSPRGTNIPSATVAPLRGLNSKDRSGSNGPYYVSPEHSYHPSRTDVPTMTLPHAQAAGYETLTPARYQDPSVQKRFRPDIGGNQSRPETTFTSMLEAINFPDPMKHSATMPEIPKHYQR